MSVVFEPLIRRLRYLEKTVQQLDRRINNMVREAVVTEVFPAEGMAKVEANGLKSKKVPWLQRAGDINEWDPPSVGERVLLLSPTGEPGTGMIMPGGYSDKFDAPHGEGGEKVTAIGDVRITQTGSSFTIVAGGVTVEISGAGLTVNGGRVEHDSLNIGSTHTHGGVTPGAGDTDVPNA